MTDLERWVVLINSLMAFVAMLVNARTAHDSTEPWRSVRIPIAALAGLYSVAYLWLFLTEDVGPWSSLMRGVSILSWPIVWIRPALVNRKVVRSIRHAIDKAKEVTE